MSASRESAPAIAPEGHPGVIARVVDIVVDPRAAFRAIAERPTWFGTLIAVVVIRFASLFVFYQPETTPGKLVIGVLFQLATIVPAVLIAGTFFWVTSNAWLVRVRWSVAFSIALHIYTAYTIATIVVASIAGALLPATVDVDLREPPFVNLSSFGSGQSPLVTRLLGELDVRAAYAAALAALGLKAARPSAAWTTIACAVATCWAARVAAVAWAASP
jgi:hypothetical protein